MTLENYKELQSYCLDLLVIAGIVEIGQVNADGSVVMNFTHSGVELSQGIIQLLRSAKDPQVKDTLIALLDSSELSDNHPEIIDLTKWRRKTKIEQKTESKPAPHRLFDI